MNNIFKDIPPTQKDEFFENILSKGGLKIERIVSKGHISPEFGWYDQDSDEWVIVLEGEAVLSFEEGEDIRLKKGDFINIPAHTKHRVSWTTKSEETIWLAIHYD